MRLARNLEQMTVFYNVIVLRHFHYVIPIKLMFLKVSVMPNTEKSKCVFIYVNYFTFTWVIWHDILTITIRKVLITNPEVENSHVIIIKQQKIWIRVMGNLISILEYSHQNSKDILRQLFIS